MAERHSHRGARAGASTAREGRRLAGQGVAIFAAGATLGHFTVRYLGGAPRTILLLTAGALLLIGRARISRSRRWTLGAGGERDVARALARLSSQWLVVHDLSKPRGGNVDHLVAGPGGLFTIETKLARFGSRELAQARAHAGWARRSFGVPATPVLVVARSRQRPRLYAGVWCMGPNRLPRFLNHQHNGAIDVQRVNDRLHPRPGEHTPRGRPATITTTRTETG